MHIKLISIILYNGLMSDVSISKDDMASEFYLENPRQTLIFQCAPIIYSKELKLIDHLVYNLLVIN